MTTAIIIIFLLPFWILIKALAVQLALLKVRFIILSKKIISGRSIKNARFKMRIINSNTTIKKTISHLT
jgi:hypothetical protein